MNSLKFLICFTAALTLVSCNSGNGATTSPEQVEKTQVDNVEVQSYEDLGMCDPSINAGKRMYVVDEDRTYECVNGTWWWGITEDIFKCNAKNLGAEKVVGGNKKHCFICYECPQGYTCPKSDTVGHDAFGRPMEFFWLTFTGSTEHYPAECEYSFDMPYAWGYNGSSTSLSSSSAYSLPSSSTSVVYGSLVDSRDGQVYKTVNIGTQTWMAQNLNYVTDNSCCYDDNPSSCIKYGQLYTWDAAMIACPSGWHLPTMKEWELLSAAVGGESTAGRKLKATTLWEAKDGIINEDAYGFSAFPAGYRSGKGEFFGEGGSAYFWNAPQNGDNYPSCMYLDHWTNCMHLEYYLDHEYYPDDEDSRFSVRCLLDDASNTENSPTSSSSLSPTTYSSSSSFTQPVAYGTLVDARDGQSYKTVKIGEQTWMAENLNYEYPANSYEDRNFCFGNEPANCPKYGRFYKDGVVNRVCPDDWHLPSENEWLDLLMSGVSVKELRSTEGWLNGMNGSNVYGFSALPGGDNVYRGSSGDEAFENEGENACFWSSTLNTGGKTVVCVTRWDTYIFLVADKYHGYTVRCVKD